jgi:hypothetical protein
MRNRYIDSILVAAAVLIFVPRLHAQSQGGAKPGVASPAATGDQQFDPHDLYGNWYGHNPDASDQKNPEPPLTEWAKQHLLYKSISHDAYGGTPIPGWDRPGHHCPNNQDPCYSKDQYGVPTNDPDGEYPAKDCEPLSSPATYDYPAIGTMEFIPTPDGTRIHQMISYHREWRTFWLNRSEHPKDLDPTYEGDSIAHWEGNTLVVDTIGYNDRTMVTQHVGHRKSDAFHLVERFTRLDHNHLRLEMTYYDPKAWGDKSWGGWYRNYRLVPDDQFEEFICSPREYKEYDSRVTTRIDAAPKK